MITEKLLIHLREAVEAFTKDLLEAKEIQARISNIILYGSAARSLFEKNAYNDFDLDVFLVKTGDCDLQKINRRGAVWKLPDKVENKRVEVLFNTLHKLDWLELAKKKAKDNNRWYRITRNPVLQLYPQRKDFRSLV